MLSPSDSIALTAALKPTPGFVFDAAVGTSFTLDLETLLTAPISFALFDTISEDDNEEKGVEPIGLLEAIRRYAQRITLFCQAGQLAIPRHHRLVYAWLEDAVYEANAPRRGHLFHPKLWLARYLSPDRDKAVLRLLCATRNVTFDSSWDTVLKLETDPYVPGQAGAKNAPLLDLFQSLGELTTREISPERQKLIDALISDLSGADFHPPEPFNEVHFHVLGINRKSEVFPEGSLVAAVASPFLGEKFLSGLLASHNVRLLLSREDSLDRISPAVLRQAERLSILNSAADLSEGDGGGAVHESADPNIALGGLHAKLYVFDTKEGSQVFTGSANATEAGFGGNVEVLAELRGPRSAGVASLLTETKGEVDFSDLLVDYTPLAQRKEETEAEKLELALTRLRTQIASLSFHATVVDADDAFSMTLQTPQPMPLMSADEVEITVWPMTLIEEQSAQVVNPGDSVEVTFKVSLEGITSFFGIRVRARRGKTEDSTRFLVNATLKGGPSNRHNQILASMLRDPQRLLRYLLLLLSDEDRLALEATMGSGQSWLAKLANAGWEEVPLLELLVRAVDRFPDRLDHIQRLLDDLPNGGEEILPPGFGQIWEAVRAARETLR